MTQAEQLRVLEAQLAAVTRELEEKTRALRVLGDRLVPVEQARELGAEAERSARQRAEVELERLEATKTFRLLLAPRRAVYRWRELRGAFDAADSPE
jgi:hypothetical protein